MSNEDALHQAVADLRRQQEQLKAVRDKLRASRTEVRSTDGMLTVTLDGRGELSGIAFNTAKWRRMPPAELGSALVETIGRAREEARGKMLSAFGPHLPKDFLPQGGGSATNRLDRMFDDAVRRVSELIENSPSNRAARPASPSASPSGRNST
jgi:DNA-binding protein YbaB